MTVYWIQQQQQRIKHSPSSCTAAKGLKTPPQAHRLVHLQPAGASSCLPAWSDAPFPGDSLSSVPRFNGSWHAVCCFIVAQVSWFSLQLQAPVQLAGLACCWTHIVLINREEGSNFNLVSRSKRLLGTPAPNDAIHIFLCVFWNAGIS